MEIFDYMGKNGYEQVVMFSDAAVGLKGIIAIHNTTPNNCTLFFLAPYLKRSQSQHRQQAQIT